MVASINQNSGPARPLCRLRNDIEKDRKSDSSRDFVQLRFHANPQASRAALA